MSGIHGTPLRMAEGVSAAALRPLPEEIPVALVYHGESHAVMMATPADIEDLAVGFTLTEGFIDGPDGIEDLEVVRHSHGIEARMALAPGAAARLAARKRSMVGPVGCGLCGIESIEQAARDLPAVPPGPAMAAGEALDALAALRDHQPMRARTGAMHGAGFWIAGRGMVLSREDVGRHNALDKLIGAMARAGIDPTAGAAVLSSRFSVEMAQKCAMAGIGLALSASLPTARAARAAEDAGLALGVPARGRDRVLEVYGAGDRLGR